MKRYAQTKDELMKHLRAQIQFMKLSAASFDNGFEDEAKRLAVVIRVLVHDTRNSISLLTLLGKKNIDFYDSAVPYDSRNLLTYNGLTMMRISTAEGASYVAPLDDGPPSRSRTRKISFKIWWDGVFVIKDKYGKTLTRKDMVRSVANTDGGAHVDPNLDETYSNLTRFNSMGWKFFRRDVKDNFRNSPALPSIRQIAHEVLKTLNDEFPDLF